MNQVARIVEYLDKAAGEFPQMVITLGSGWSEVLHELEVEKELSFEDVFGVKAGVKGHAGKLVIGTLSGKPVALMAGRFHIYEGYSAEESTRWIRAFSQLGMKQLVLTSAAGGLNEDYMVGDMVVLQDVITTFLLDNPLSGPTFIDMSQCFDKDLRIRAVEVCKKAGVRYEQGVYAYLKGPHYETPADKRLLQTLGTDVVGMSMVPEILVARSLDIRVLGLSYVTNLAFVKHSHEEVVKAAQAGSEGMVKVLKGVVS